MPVIRAIFLSFGFHIFLILCAIWLVPRFELSAPPETIEITLDDEAAILDALTPDKQQIVRQSLVPEKMKAPDDDNLARFLSEQKQRVRQEQQAAQSGMTQNRQAEKPVTKPQPANQQRGEQTAQKNEASNEVDKDGFRNVDISQQLQEMNRLSEGYSTIGESMPRDMKVGSFTALNTDRYVYYTFYARMEELIRYRWESKVQNAINSFDRTSLRNVGNRNWVTHVEFLLDKNGLLKEAKIMKESGVRYFDAAAIDAFREARIFPNPPAGMVQDDGMIRIKFSFTVNFNPTSLANGNY